MISSRRMLLTLALAVPLLAAATTSLARISHGGNRKEPAASGNTTPVLVELFTSEGCSSCPPADTLLARLVKTQPIAGAHIIALGEHVDYWNRLGWRDPYSSAAFSARQGEYATAFRNDQVYTPQMVVDGHVEFVGSDADAAENAIRQAARQPKAHVSLDAAPGGTFTVHVADLPSGVSAADVYAAVVENGLTSNVTRGENAGRRLTHAAVARPLASLGTVTPGKPFQATFTPSAATRGTTSAIVAFVQEKGTGRVIGAADSSFR